MGLLEDVYDDETVKCVYLAALLILVLVIMMHVLKLGLYYERFSDDQVSNLVDETWAAGKVQHVETPIGTGYAAGSLPPMSGPNIRFNVFTDTSQVPYGTGYNVHR